MSANAGANAYPAPVKPDAAARRNRLRQYQVQLLERMQAAKANVGARVNQLGVQIGGRRYLLDLTHAGEIVPLGALTVVPLTQPWYLGLSNIRGNLVGVVDIALYQGHAGAPLGLDSRVVTFAAPLGFNCGLLVERVFGLRNAADMQFDGGQLRDADANAWELLDLTALVQETRFLHVGF